MSRDIEPLLRAFAEYFATWGIELPREAVDGRRDGQLHAHGWSIRWRWREGDRLEFRATHRMTNERWLVIARDGTMTWRDVPSEYYRADVPGVQEDYRAAWRAHGQALEDAGMQPRQLETPPAFGHTTEMLWALDGEPARASPL